jgi:DNA repair exonuclease SbcCD ATPase subunit
VLGALTVLAIAGAAAAFLLQQQEHTVRLAAERQLALVKADNDQLQHQISEVRTAQLALETELGRVKAQADEVAQQLAQERQAKDVLAKSVDDRQREIDRLGKDMEQLRTERQTLQQHISQLNQQQATWKTQLAELEKAKSELETKVLELSGQPTVELDKVVVNKGEAASEASMATALAPTANKEGQVIVVNREYDFIVMNLGKNQGLEIGQQFQVVRGDDVLGWVKVEKVYDELAAAAILPQSQKEQIREGDAVQAL